MTESAPEQSVRARITVRGRVQGVGYRAFAARVAVQRGLFGGVRNLDDGRVELDVEGTKVVIEALLLELAAGPPTARVEGIETRWSAPIGQYSTFNIWY